MQYIEKNDEPEKFAEFKRITPTACFDDMDNETSDALKGALLSEQGFICCYCGKRIELNENTIFEHLLCRKYNKDKEKNYDNLLASCDGGQSDRRGKPQRVKRLYPQHCDDKKNNSSIDISPLEPDCERQFGYDDEGGIYDLTDAAKQTIQVLGLNCVTIRNRRRAAIAAYKALKESGREETLLNSFWEERLRYNSHRDETGRFPQYCFAVRYYINNYCLLKD